MQNYFNNLEESATIIHSGNVAKGFWEPRQSLPLSVALAIGELYEALEAARGSRAKADYVRFDANTLAAKQHYKPGDASVEIPGVTVESFLIRVDHYQLSFKEFVKDTVADELADFVIRCLDLAKGHSIDLAQTQALYEDFVRRWSKDVYFNETELAEQLLYATSCALNIESKVLRTGRQHALAEALARVFLYCQANDINLNWHIHYKLLYNATRAAKHGKNF